MPVNNHWSEERWTRLVKRWCSDFGPEAAAKIVESTIYECGGERLTLPSLQDLQRRERDRKICDLFTGNNILELAERFRVEHKTIRRAVLRQRIIDRQKIPISCQNVGEDPDNVEV